MLSKKSYFKPALFWDDIRRFSPIWVCASLVTLVIPCALWTQWLSYTQRMANGTDYYQSGTLVTPAYIAIDFNETLLDLLCEAGPTAMLLYAVLPAMALLSFLYQSRSALGIHALPTTRTELFLTHYAAGIAMIVLPLLVFSAATTLVLLLAGSFWPLTLLTFCAGILGMYLFFFSFAFFCGMFTGQLWGLPVFYAIFNALACITLYVFTMLADSFLYGFYFSEDSALLTLWLTPVWQLTENLSCASVTSMGNFTIYGLGTVALYALAGLCFAACSLCIFSNRHLERAGEIVSVRVMRPIFILCLSLYGGFCAVPVGSTIFSVYTLPWMLFFLVLGVLFGFAAGKMLLEKSIAILSLRNLKQLAALVCVASLSFVCIFFDLLGYSTYIPEAEDIASVQVEMPLYLDAITIWDVGYTTSSDAEIALVCAAQATLIADYQETGEMYNYTLSSALSDEASALNEQGLAQADAYTYYNSSTALTISYTLTSGQVIHRYYYLNVSPSETLREGSAASYLETLANQIDAVDYITEISERTSVELYDRTSSNSVIGAEGSTLTVGALVALLTDLVATDSQMSILQKNYATQSTTYFSMQTIEKWTDGSTYHDTLLYANPRPGSELEAYILEKVG